jgi:hypothetical protein
MIDISTMEALLKGEAHTVDLRLVSSLDQLLLY